MIYFIGNADLVGSTLYEHTTIDNCIRWLSFLKEVNLDVETEGMMDFNNKVVMLQLHYGDTTYVIDTRCTDIKGLKPYLESILVVGHNLKFDYKFLKFHGIEFNSIYDTQLAEMCLTNGFENRELKLMDLTKKYTGNYLNKETRGQFSSIRNGSPFTDEQILYGAKDVMYLTEIKEKQLKEIEQLDIANWVNNEFGACLALGDIEYNGMGFDPVAWTKLAEKSAGFEEVYVRELDELVKAEPKLGSFVSAKVQGNLFAGVEEGFEHGRNVRVLWSSPSQVLDVFVKLGLAIDNTSEKTLAKFQNKFPLVKKFIDFKKQQKLVSTYGLNFLDYINPVTKRIHTSFWQIVETTRVSSGDKWSPNMQNLPAKNEYRNCFIPRKGFKMVSCDFAGQELRLTAFGSQEPIWCDAFNKGEDLHSKMASLIFSVPIEKVKDKPDFLRGKSYRDVAKTINFGLVYGMSKFKLSDSLSITLDAADKIIKDYFKATTKLNEFLGNLRKYGMKNGFIRCFAPYEIIRYFPKWSPDLGDFKEIGSIERASMNTPIQGAGAQMCKRALVKIRQYIKLNSLQDKVYIVMTVHDQIDCEVEESYAEEWSIIQKGLMEEAGREIISGIPVISDITIADMWTK